MKNQRVYLAKSNLARGLDFEYVKSNLLRVPGIEVMELGDGVNPSDCTCIVFVHSDISQIFSEEEISLNRNNFTEINEFLANNENDNAIERVLIYSGEKKHNNDSDVESGTPTYVFPFGVEIFDEESWEDYGTLTLEDDNPKTLLSTISKFIGARDNYSWIKNSRHHMPENKYAMPPIPDMRNRTAKGTRRIESDIEDDDICDNNHIVKHESVSQEVSKVPSARLVRKKRIL